MTTGILTGREIVFAALKDETGIREDDIKLDGTFASLKLDSLDTISVIIAIEANASIDLDDNDIDQAATIRELISLVDAQLAKQAS